MPDLPVPRSESARVLFPEPGILTLFLPFDIIQRDVWGL